MSSDLCNGVPEPACLSGAVREAEGARATESAFAGGEAGPQGLRRDLVALARWVLSSRRDRARLLGDLDFGEPSWDILLDMFIAGEEGSRVSVSGVCVSCQVPTTTALRQVHILVGAGYLERIPDVNDRRRVFLRLSAEARLRMVDCLDGMLQRMRRVVA